MQFQWSVTLYTQVGIEVTHQNYSIASETAADRHTLLLWTKKSIV